MDCTSDAVSVTTTEWMGGLGGGGGCTRSILMFIRQTINTKDTAAMG